MDRVLIIDDDAQLLEMIAAYAKSYTDRFCLITASDGEDALKLLDSQEFSLVVTDIQMPRVDGFAVLEFMRERFPYVPCAVITAHGTLDRINRLLSSGLSVIKKPFRLETLFQVVLSSLERDRADGFIKGISIGNLLQLMEMEMKSCTLEVTSLRGERGGLFIRSGRVVDAHWGKLRGEQAAVRAVMSETSGVKMKPAPGGGAHWTPRIDRDAMSLIMEAAQHRDESYVSDVVDSELRGVIEQPAAGTGPGDGKPGIAVEPILARYLEGFRKLDGFRGVALLGLNGEILFAESGNTEPRFLEAVHRLGDFWRYSREICREVGYGESQEMTLQTPRDIVLMRCSSPSFVAWSVAVIHAGGNLGLLRVIVRKMMAEIGQLPVREPPTP